MIPIRQFKRFMPPGLTASYPKEKTLKICCESYVTFSI